VGNGLSKKLDFSIVQAAFDARGLILLSNESEYRNAQSPLRFLCPLHLSEGEQNKTWSNFIKPQGCKYCGNKQARDSRRVYDFDKDIKSGFKDSNCELLTTESEFESTPVKDDLILRFICHKHINAGIQRKKLNSFKLRKSCCQYCANQKINDERKRNTFVKIKLAFDKKGLILKTTVEEYLGAHSPLEYYCPKHLNEIQITTWGSFRNYKDQCLFCRYCSNIKLANERRQGALKQLSHYLRDYIITWRKDSMVSSRFKCVITGGKFDVVHHLHSYNQILKETLGELNIPLYDDYSAYTFDELNLIKERLLRNHYKYPLGVCLREDIHKEYHSIYGHNNTPEQFEEFKQFKLNQLKQNELTQHQQQICEVK
jgi:hypothetical protein